MAVLGREREEVRRELRTIRSECLYRGVVCGWRRILGIVASADHDFVTPRGGAIQIARHFGEVPGNTLKGLKRLIQFSSNDLKDYLEYENQEFFKIVQQHSYQQAVDPTAWTVL